MSWILSLSRQWKIDVSMRGIKLGSRIVLKKHHSLHSPLKGKQPDSFQWHNIDSHSSYFQLVANQIQAFPICPSWVWIENQFHQHIQTYTMAKNRYLPCIQFWTPHYMTYTEELCMLEPPSCKPTSVECTTDCRKVHLLDHLTALWGYHLLAFKVLSSLPQNWSAFVITLSQTIWGLAVYCGCKMDWAAASPSIILDFNEH